MVYQGEMSKKTDVVMSQLDSEKQRRAQELMGTAEPPLFSHYPETALGQGRRAGRLELPL